MLVWRIEHRTCMGFHGPYNTTPWGCYSSEVHDAMILMSMRNKLSPPKVPVDGRHSGFVSLLALREWFGPTLPLLDAHGYHTAVYDTLSTDDVWVRQSDGHVLFHRKQARCLGVSNLAHVSELVAKCSGKEAYADSSNFRRNMLDNASVSY